MPLFHGLDTTELTMLNGLLQRRRVPAGGRIIEAGEGSTTAHIIISGAVKVQIERSDGCEVFLAILGAGEVVGEMGLVDHYDRSASVVALVETTIASMACGDFWHCLQAIPQMTYNLLEIVSRRLRVANGRIEALAALDVEGRVARCLLDVAQAYGEPVPGGGRLIPIRLTQQDLAALVGASRVRVNQILGEYRRRCYIAFDERQRILVLNPAGLSQACQ
jgi:CRP/FNR family cyclic AMP-dependent transcriptional regulator